MRLYPQALLGSFSALLVLLMSTGCGPGGPETAPVSGTVTLDGQPVAGAAVMLVPESAGRPAHGVTDSQGKFTLTTFEEGDGALVGKHSVTVTLKKVTGMLADVDGLSGGVAPGGIKEEWIIPKKYSSPKTSGLSAEVKKSGEPLVLDLKSE